MARLNSSAGVSAVPSALSEEDERRQRWSAERAIEDGASSRNFTQTFPFCLSVALPLPIRRGRALRSALISLCESPALAVLALRKGE